MMRADAHRPSHESTASEPPAETSNLADEAAATPTPRHVPLLPNADPDADTVGRFMLACLRRAKGEEVAGGAIYARYQRWCSEQQPPLDALAARTFAQQYAERCERVGIRTRRDGNKVYCLDVRLAA